MYSIKQLSLLIFSIPKSSKKIETFMYLDDTIKKSAHGFSSPSLCFLHCVKFDQHSVNLRHDTADRMLHSVDTSSQHSILLVRYTIFHQCTLLWVFIITILLQWNHSPQCNIVVNNTAELISQCNFQSHNAIVNLLTFQSQAVLVSDLYKYIFIIQLIIIIGAFISLPEPPGSVICCLRLESD